MTPSRLYTTITCFCLLFLIAPFALSAQVSGCKDPAATNYNPAATVNDGTCTYSAASYTPPVKVNPLSSSLAETSGLQWAGNYLWTLNDGGSPAAIYRIDTTSNAILQTVNLGGTTNVDWEDMSFDGTHFYIGDFGNNSGGRRDLKIYKFPISAIPTHVGNPEVTVPSSQILERSLRIRSTIITFSDRSLLLRKSSYLFCSSFVLSPCILFDVPLIG